MDIFPYKTIAGLLLIIGLLLLADGLYIDKTGDIITSRYETGSGRFLRNLSHEDQTYYSYMKTLKKISILLELSGAFITIAGIFLFTKPELAFLAVEHIYHKWNPKIE